MNKKSLLIICCLVIPTLVNYVFGQAPMKNGKVFYETVDTINMSKERIYDRSKLWLANTFNDSKAVIEIDDTNELVGKGNFIVYYTYALTPSQCRTTFTLKIDIKDNKYRLQLYNFLCAFGSNEVPAEAIDKSYGKSINKKVTAEMDKKTNDLIADFRNAMTAAKDNSF